MSRKTLTTCKQCGKNGEVGGWGLCDECFDMLNESSLDSIQEVMERDRPEGDWQGKDAAFLEALRNRPKQAQP